MQSLGMHPAGPESRPGAEAIRCTRRRDHEGLRNPVEQWRAAGGRPHRRKQCTIRPPAEVLPRWHRGIETAVRNPVARDAFRFGLYTGMRRAEVFSLAWARIDMAAMTFRVEDTKTGEAILPIDATMEATLRRTRECGIRATPWKPDMRFRDRVRGANGRHHPKGAGSRRMSSMVFPASGGRLRATGACRAPPRFL